MKEVVLAQAETLRAWAQMWSADDSSGSDEVAFLLRRAAKIMETGDVEPAEGEREPSSFPVPVVQSDVTPEPDE